jgi:hypothetical protein
MIVMKLSVSLKKTFLYFFSGVVITQMAYHPEKKAIERLRATTTNYGLVQHSKLEVPDTSFDYSVDDSSRALVVLSRFSRNFKDEELARIYLDYLISAKRPDGWFENYRRADGSLAETASEMTRVPYKIAMEGLYGL